MRVNLFDIDIITGKPKITSHVKDIYYLRNLLNTYGEEVCVKLFKLFDFNYNLNVDENPFANLPEDKKFDTILRSVYPELISVIDFESEDFIMGLDLVGELYETPKYRAYKTIKSLHDRILSNLEFTNISLYKEDGNMGEINKALDAFEDLYKKLKETYNDLEEENQTIRRKGGRVSSDRRSSGKQKELE